MWRQAGTGWEINCPNLGSLIWFCAGSPSENGPYSLHREKFQQYFPAFRGKHISLHVHSALWHMVVVVGYMHWPEFPITGKHALEGKSLAHLKEMRSHGSHMWALSQRVTRGIRVVAGRRRLIAQVSTTVFSKIKFQDKYTSVFGKRRLLPMSKPLTPPCPQWYYMVMPSRGI